MLGDFLLADLKRLFFAAAVDLLDAQVVLRSDARKRAQRLHDRLIRHEDVYKRQLLNGFVVCAFIRKSVHKHHLDVELQEAKAAAEAENAAAAENTAPVPEGNDEQTH